MACFDTFWVEFSDDRKTLVCWHKDFQGGYVIPHGVISIGDDAFFICRGLTSITIPDSVTNIGKTAFYGCESLTSIVIPNSVISIGDSAFNDCRSLTSATIGNGVTSIGNSAFLDCKCLSDVIIGNRVTIIGEEAFAWCEELTAITIPNSVTSIGKAAFFGCRRLSSVAIPNSVKNIGDFAFCGCEGLNSVTLGYGITKIGNNVFSGCNNLTEIFVPDGQENRFCEMDGLQGLADIIRSSSAKQKFINRREEQEQRLMQEQQMQERLQGSILFFDTETTGKPLFYNAPVTDSDNWPRLVQLAWIMTNKEGKVLKKKSVIIRPDGFSIPIEAAAIHGITTERAQREGLPLVKVLEEFGTDLSLAEHIVGHNIDFDRNIVSAEVWRLCWDYNLLMDKPCTCTMKTSTKYCAIPNPNTYFGGYKWPSLQELYQKLFNRSFEDAHDALADITATKECYFELKQRGIIKE